MVFGHREKIESTWTRILVVIWCFLVLILTQSYTASLTSRLTFQQNQPIITDINQLIAKREHVGFQEGSFVEGLLKQMGFEDSQFKTYSSPDELQRLFESGTSKGGIAAAFDETPYMKLFIAKYCSKFAMVEPTFKADGFAFFFPRGSPLVPDVSRAILKVTEGRQMKDIEAIWFKKEEANCPDPNEQRPFESLGFESFRGLFIIVGSVAAAVFVFPMGIFLYKQRATLLNPNPSRWKNIKKVFEKFLEKERCTNDGDRETVVAEANGDGAPIGLHEKNEQRVADNGAQEIVAQANDGERAPALRV